MKVIVHIPPTWKFILMLVCCMCCMQYNFGQGERTVSGTVTDNTEESIPGVNVLVKGSSVGTITDIDGSYTIKISEGSNILVFSFIGYQTQEVDIGNSTQVDVSLEPSLADMEEVVVIGFGEMSREVLTTSVSKMDERVLESVPFANAASALQGTVSGVRVQSVTGQPGAPPRVIVRGGTSINNPNGATPLFIIDGVIRQDMNDLNPEDIESMQVLKDAASTSIYGARGSNGVVIIKTKSGRAGTTKINYRSDLTVSTPSLLYDHATAREFLYFQRVGTHLSAQKTPSLNSLLTGPWGGGVGNDLTNNTGFTPQYLSDENRHKLEEGWETMQDPLDPTQTIIFKGTDFQDKLFRTSFSHNHALTASGGTENATFNIGLGYLNSQGTAISTDFERLTLNMNGDVKVNNSLKLFGRLMYSNTSDNRVPSEGVVFKNNLNTAQTSKYRFEDGTLAPGRLFTNGNPEYYISRYNTRNSRDMTTLAVGGQWDIFPGLSFEPQASIYTRETNERSFLMSYLNGPGQLNENRSASASFSKLINTQFDGVFNYFKTLGNEHNVQVNAGFQYLGTDNQSFSASGRGAASDAIPTLNASAEPVSVTGSETRLVTMGYFGRLTYDYAQKYLLSINARHDGASNLGDNYKWGFFPGISLGWNIHKEDFWQSVAETFDRVKLRASYGVNGNIGGLGPYQAQGQYGVGNRYANIAAVQNLALANPNLQWEQSSTYNGGIDFGMFNSRISVMVDVFRRVTDNLLTNFSLPHSTGFSSILTNLGSLENKGVEIEITGMVLPERSPLQWNASFNASKVRNKILRLPENGQENNRIGGVFVWDSTRGDYAWLGGLQEGGTMGEMFAYKQLGIYPTDEAAQAGPTDIIIPGDDKTKHGGDVNWLDVDGDGVIDERDRIHVGNSFPVWTGGFSNTMSYKNFSLYFRMDFTTGHTIYNETLARTLGNFSGQNALNALVNNSWQQPGDITDIPRYYWADQNQKRNLWRGNSAYYEPGDFLNIREVTFSYILSKTLVERINISNVRINLTGNNLLYFTQFRGLNPEEGGTDNGRFPIPRNIIFGLNITL